MATEKDILEKWRQKAQEERNEERKKLLAISEFDALKLPIPDRYQRMRYQREIEAAEWLAEIRRNMPTETVKKAKYQKNVITWKQNDD